MIKTYLAFILALFISSSAFAQKEWSVYGNVFNESNDRPISGLSVTNLRNNHVVVTNGSGDFYIRAAEGDSLEIRGIGFARKAILWNKNLGDIKLGLEQTAISLDEVVVKDKRSRTIEREIKEFLDNPHNGETMKRDIKGNIIQTSAAGGLGGGAGISIDALYDLWSKEGKNNRKAASLEYEDLKKFYIALRFNKNKVADITGLKEPDLSQFMEYCQLSDDFVLRASDYDLTYKIVLSLREFNNTASFPVLKKN